MAANGGETRNGVTPVSNDSTRNERLFLFFFTKLALEQLHELLNGRFSILAFGIYANGGAFRGGENDHLHHAFAIGFTGFFPTLENRDLGLELVGHVHELHGRPRVKAQR